MFFLVIALVAALFGFGGMAGVARDEFGNFATILLFLAALAFLGGVLSAPLV
jgi:uncharacterized membrane protein YtjA (UPF0391 family)